MDDVEVRDRLLKRDSRVLNHLFDRYGAPLHGVIMGMVEHKATAQGVLQDTFREVWEKADTYDPKKTKCFTWMMVIARRLARKTTEYRSSKDNTADDRSSEHQTTGRQELTPIIELLDQLSPEERTMVSLVVLKGNTPAETARRLGLPIETVHSKLREALLKCRHKLQLLP